MASSFPHFKSQFLDRLCRQFEKRQKAQSYWAKQSVETKQPDEFEWFTVNHAVTCGHYVIFQFVEDNRANIYVRSSRRRDRGKMLLRIEGIRLFDNSEAIVECCEVTIKQARDNKELFENSSAIENIRETWEKVRIGIMGSKPDGTADET